MKTATPILWDSPINSESIFESKKTISNLQAWKDGLLFLITEPSEGNINVLMYSDTNSVTKRVSPKGFNIRSKIHEYGGRPFTADGDDIFYCNFNDQEIYSQSFLSASNTFSSPVAVTDSHGDKVRYADLSIDRKRNRLIAVREDHRFIKTSVDEEKNSLKNSMHWELSQKKFSMPCLKSLVITFSILPSKILPIKIKPSLLDKSKQFHIPIPLLSNLKCSI